MQLKQLQEAEEAAKYPHDMFDPETGEKEVANSEAEHKALAAKGYTHEKPEDEDEDALEEAFEVMLGESIEDTLKRIKKLGGSVYGDKLTSKKDKTPARLAAQSRGKNKKTVYFVVTDDGHKEYKDLAAVKKDWTIAGNVVDTKIAFELVGRQGDGDASDIIDAILNKYKINIAKLDKIANVALGAKSADDFLNESVSLDESFEEAMVDLEEAKIKASDYEATSEKSKFGGHRPTVVHKTKGTTLWLGAVGFKTPKAAKAAADAYLSGYAIGSEKGAKRMLDAHIKNNKKNLVDPSILDEAANWIDGTKYQKEKKKKGFNKDDWEWNSSKQLYKKVEESVALDEAFLRLPGEMINGELPMAIRDLESILKGLKAGNDFDEKGFNKQMARLTAVKKAAKKFNSEKEVPTRYQYTKKESVALDGDQLDEAYQQFTDKTPNWGEDQALTFGRKKGYKEVAVMSDNNSKHPMVLFALDSGDKKYIKGSNVKSGETVFRYATKISIAGDIFPLVKVNIAKGIYYNLTQESSEGTIEDAKFENKGVKLKFFRSLEGAIKESVELDEDYFIVQYYDKKGKADTTKFSKFDDASKAKKYLDRANKTNKEGEYKMLKVKGKMEGLEEANVFGTQDNYGSSDSLLAAVNAVVSGQAATVEVSTDDTNAIVEQGVEAINEDSSNDKSDDGDGLDKVQPKAVKKKFKDRKDKDLDNDGDVDDSDKFLHKKRKAISKAIDKDDSEEKTEDKEEDKKDVKSGKKEKVDIKPKLDEAAFKSKYGSRWEAVMEATIKRLVEQQELNEKFTLLKDKDIAPLVLALKDNISVELKDPKNNNLLVTMQTTDDGVQVKYKTGRNTKVGTEKSPMPAIKSAVKFLKAKELAFREL
tara:strand:- start:14871 stop:17492 length:2622 start_codon:yes stop_codon:yes gene_type:complete